MAVTFLQKAVAAAYEPQKTCIDVIKKQLGGYQPARSHKTLHASDITKPNFCPRQSALLDLLGTTKKDEYIPTALQATFDVGNLTGELVREKWMGQAAYGNWWCNRCGKSHTFCQQPIKHPCKAGGLCNFRYEEPNFVHAKLKISGSIDMLADLGAPKLFIVELKIMAVDAFEKLVAPLAEHRLRTNLYMNIVDNSNSPYKSRVNVSEARVLYVSRGFGKKNPDYEEILPFKEYVVERHDDSLESYFQKATALDIFKTSGKIPFGVCKTSMDTPAKKCSVAKACFSGKYPACS